VRAPLVDHSTRLQGPPQSATLTLQRGEGVWRSALVPHVTVGANSNGLLGVLSVLVYLQHVVASDLGQLSNPAVIHVPSDAVSAAIAAAAGDAALAEESDDEAGVGAWHDVCALLAG
jgi:hypothetical protein